jgi:hypothetical protein
MMMRLENLTADPNFDLPYGILIMTLKLLDNCFLVKPPGGATSEAGQSHVSN